jgi:proteasome lid subunit RPN8/RPN11
MEVTPAPETPAVDSDVPADRDVANIVAGQWPARELERLRDERQPGFQAVIARSALNDMHRHGRSTRDVEVCGVLVGNVYHDASGPYLYVEASIKGENAAGKTAQVTFTAETWNHINDEMERHYPGKKILGWYHTHPGFGIFLSEMDLFIQNNFFPEPWQVAYVYDPKSGEDGLFVWKKGQATQDTFLVDPDTINTDPPQGRKDEPAPTSGTLSELTERVQALEHKTRWLTGVLVLVAALAVLSPMLLKLFAPSDALGTMGAQPEDIAPPIPASLQVPTTQQTTHFKPVKNKAAPR